MATQIQLRHGTAAQWTSVNPLLAQGEIGYELDTSLSKLGTGLSNWNSLPYLTASRSITASYALNGGGGGGGTTLTTGSTYAITSSWAVSASWAPMTVTPTSVASASWVSASVRITTADTASYYNQLWLVTGSVYPITSSWAVSASYAPGSSIPTSVTSSISSSYLSGSTAIISTLLLQTSSFSTLRMAQSNGDVVVNIDTNDSYTGTGTRITGAPRIILGKNPIASGDDSAILIQRNLSGSALFSHGVADQGSFESSGGGAYASFDSMIRVTGSNSYNHLMSFQARPIYSSGNSIGIINGHTFLPTINGPGTASAIVGFYCYDSVGDGPITTQVGLQIDKLTKGVNTYAIYTGDNPIYFGGTLQIAKSITSTLGSIQMVNIKSNAGNNAVSLGELSGDAGTVVYGTFLGYGAGGSTAFNQYNTFVGWKSGFTNTAGNYNTNLGAGSGYTTTGSSNIFIGYRAGYYQTGSNTLIIDNINRASLTGENNGALIYGITNITNSNQVLILGGGGKVGINKVPSYTLDVSGSVNASNNLIVTGSVVVLQGVTGSVLGTSSYSTSASYALNGGGSGTTLVTGSTYPITSSWSTNSITASYILSGSNFRLMNNALELWSPDTNKWFVLGVYDDGSGYGSLTLTTSSYA